MRIGTVSVSLLLAVALALVGNGLLGTLVVIRLADASVHEAASGWILACYFAGLTAGTFVLPGTVQRVGNIRAFAAFAALGAASALAHGFVPAGWAYAPLRAVTGLSMAGLYVSVESWLNADAEPSQRGRVMAAYLVALYLGNGVGQLLLPLLPERGLEAFAFAALAVSLAAIPVSLTRTNHPEFGPSSRQSARSLLAVAPLGWWAAVLSGFVAGTIYSNIPFVMRSEGLDSSEVSRMMAAFVLGGLAGQWPVGWLSDRIDRRTVILLTAGTLALLCGVFFVLEAPAPRQRALLAFGFGALAFALYPLAVAHTIDRVGDGQSLPAAAQMLLASSLGTVVGPIVGSAASSMFGSRALYALDGALLLALTLGIALRMAHVRAVAQQDFVAVPRTSFVVNDIDPRNHPEVQAETP